MNRPLAALLALALLAAAAPTPVAGATGGVHASAAPDAPDAPAVASGGDACPFPVTVTDATNASVTVPEEPSRIVVLGPSGAQTVWEVGAGGRVVGIDAFSTYLAGSGDAAVVSGGIGQVDYERALDLNPDLILVAGNSYSEEVATRFRDSDVPTYKLASVSTIGGVVETTRRTGRLVGACEGANDTVARIRERVDTVSSAVAGEPRPTVFYDLGATRDGDAHYSVGPSSFIGDLLSTAGGENIVTRERFSSAYPQVTNEYILERDPAWLVVTYTPNASYGPATPAAAKAAVGNSSVLSKTRAYRRGHVVAVNGNELNQPAPRLTRPLTQLARAFHPEAYAAANRTTTATTAPTTAGSNGSNATTARTAADTTPSATESGGASGFTAGAALAALLALCALAARR